MSKKVFFAIFLFLLLTIQAWFGYLYFRFPYLGINVVPIDDNKWVVSNVGRETTGLDVKIGDIINRINNQDPNLHLSVLKWMAVEQADSLEIIRGSVNISLEMSNVKNSLRHDILPIIAEMICFTATLLLLFRVRNSISAKYLAYLFFVIGITFMSLGASIKADIVGKLLVGLSLTLIPIVFLQFLIVFFKEKANLQLVIKVQPILYVPVIFQSAVWISWIGSNQVSYVLYDFNAKVILTAFMLGMAFDFGILFYLYFQHRKKQSSFSSIIRFVITSMVISFFPVIILSFIPKLIYGKDFGSSYLTSWFVLIFPLAFAYLIITKQIFDIHMVLRRVFFTVLMALIPSMILSGLSTALFYEHLSIRKSILFFFFCLVVLTFVLYSAEHMYTRMERLMFPRKYYLQAALKKIAKDLTSTSSFRELKDLILVDIVSTLEVYGGAIAFKYRDSIEIISEGDIDESAVKDMIGREAQLDHPDFISFEINKHEEYTSYLIMTHKRSNTLLVLEEVQWLGLIVSYLAVSLENVYLIRKLTDKMNRMSSQSMGEQDTQEMSWFRKLTFELQERERMRIAADMHDTTMQDLFHLKRKIAALGDKYALPAEAKENVRSLVEYVEIINVTLRQNCFDLHPYLLQEIGFIRTVEKIVERESYACPFEIRFEAAGAYAIERQQLETKRHLFRIVQELLNNARKHSEASVVSLRLSMSNGSFHLHYRDDGVGFEPERLQAMSDIRTSGVGMEQLRSRILHMHGHLELEAHKGEGVRMNISFPMKEGISA
jgi:two-component system sensor histidine kinase ComP